MSLSHYIIILLCCLLFFVILMAICSLTLQRLRSYPPDKGTQMQIRFYEKASSLLSVLAVASGALAAVMIIILVLN